MGTAIDLQTRVDELAKRKTSCRRGKRSATAFAVSIEGSTEAPRTRVVSSRSSFTFGCSAGAVLGKGSPAGSNRRASPPR